MVLKNWLTKFSSMPKGEEVLVSTGFGREKFDDEIVADEMRRFLFRLVPVLKNSMTKFSLVSKEEEVPAALLWSRCRIRVESHVIGTPPKVAGTFARCLRLFSGVLMAIRYPCFAFVVTMYARRESVVALPL